MSTLKNYLKGFSPKTINITLEENVCPSHNTAKYIENCKENCTNIFNSLFDKNDEIIFGTNSLKYKNHENEFNLIRLNSYIKGSRPLKTLNCVISNSNDEDLSHVENYYLSCKVSDLKYSLLICDLMEKDFGYSKKGLEDYFIINKSKDVILYLYDDREVTIAFKNEDDLKNFKVK